MTNAQDRKKQSNNILGLPGLSWDKKRQVWVCRVQHKGKMILNTTSTNMRVAVNLIGEARAKIKGVSQQPSYCEVRKQVRKIQSNNTSKVTGLSWNEKQQTWVCRIKYKGKYILNTRRKDFAEAKMLIKKAREAIMKMQQLKGAPCHMT